MNFHDVSYQKRQHILNSSKGHQRVYWSGQPIYNADGEVGGVSSRIFLQNDQNIVLLPRPVSQAKGMKNVSIRLRFATASNAKVLH